MDKKDKKLLVVVETSASFSTKWEALRSGYLEKIIRHFCSDEVLKLESSAEMAVITVAAHGPHLTPTWITKSGWVKDSETFIKMINDIDFTGGDYDNAPIAEALAEVLTKIPKVDVDECHCILVCANPPSPQPTSVYIPRVYTNYHDVDVDAKGVATCFMTGGVSLSVICPHKLPEIEALYHAGNKSDQTEDDPTTVIILKDQNHMVLIPKNFEEARAALSEPELDLPPIQPNIENALDFIRTRRSQIPNCDFIRGTDMMLLNSFGGNQKSWKLVWEGSLTANASSFGKDAEAPKERLNPSGFVLQLKGLMNVKDTADSIAKDWPKMIYVEKFLPQNQNINFTGNVDHLLFQQANDKEFVLPKQIQDDNSRMMVKLPTQSLIVSLSADKSKLVGTLMPQEAVTQPQE